MLKVSIPGCESLEKLSDTEMKATAAVKIGPISARFTGNVQLSELDPPNGYTIGGEGQGGVAGFAKGGAKVRLADDGDDTLLSYEVHAQVGGKIAQLGARLIDASAKQMADAVLRPVQRPGGAAAGCGSGRPGRTGVPAAPSEAVAEPVLPPANPPPPSACSPWCRASRSACRWSRGSAARSSWRSSC